MSSVSTIHHSNRGGRGSRVAILCAIVACAGPSSLLAQTTLSPRVYQGQFGTTTDTTARAEARPDGDGFEAYDDNVNADQNGSLPNPSTAQVGGFFTQFGGTANYAWQKRGLQFAATGASTFRYYNDLERSPASAIRRALDFRLNWLAGRTFRSIRLSPIRRLTSTASFRV